MYKSFPYHLSTTESVFIHLDRTRRVTITNFCLGKHLLSDDELLTDQRGSPAYISPDVLSGWYLIY